MKKIYLFFLECIEVWFSQNTRIFIQTQFHRIIGEINHGNLNLFGKTGFEWKLKKMNEKKKSEKMNEEKNPLKGIANLSLGCGLLFFSKS